MSVVKLVLLFTLSGGISGWLLLNNKASQTNCYSFAGGSCAPWNKDELHIRQQHPANCAY